MSESLAFELSDEQRVRIRGPCVGEDEAEDVPLASPAQHPAGEEEREHREQVERERGGVGGGEVVPRPRPGEHLLEGRVGVVVDGAVRVARAIVLGEVAVQVRPVGDPVRADHARVADVDHVRVRHVQADPETDQEDQAEHQPRRGNEQERKARAARSACRERASISMRTSRYASTG